MWTQEYQGHAAASPGYLLQHIHCALPLLQLSEVAVLQSLADLQQAAPAVTPACQSLDWCLRQPSCGLPQTAACVYMLHLVTLQTAGKHYWLAASHAHLLQSSLCVQDQSQWEYAQYKAMHSQHKQAFLLSCDITATGCLHMMQR